MGGQSLRPLSLLLFLAQHATLVECQYGFIHPPDLQQKAFDAWPDAKDDPTGKPSVDWVIGRARMTMASIDYPIFINRVVDHLKRDIYLEQPIMPKNPNWLAKDNDGSINGNFDYESEIMMLKVVHIPVHKDAQIHDELRKINEAEIVYRDLPPNGTANWVAENREVAVPPEGLGLQTTEIVSYPYSNVTLRGVVSLCDEKEAREVWFERWRRSFPEGPATDYYRVLRFDPRSIVINAHFIKYIKEDWRGFAGWVAGYRRFSMTRKTERYAPWENVRVSTTEWWEGEPDLADPVWPEAAAGKDSVREDSERRYSDAVHHPGAVSR